MVTNTKLVKANANRLPVTLEVTRQEREIMALGKANHWPFRVLGVAPVPRQPVFFNNWWLVPIEQDPSPIPDHARQRINAVYAVCVPVKAMVLAHQAEKQLAPPAGTRIISPTEYWSKRVLDQSLTVLKAAGTVAAVVVPVLATALGTGLLLSVGVVGALVADPILCVVTDDDVWIAIDEWMA